MNITEVQDANEKWLFASEMSEFESPVRKTRLALQSNQQGLRVKGELAIILYCVDASLWKYVLHPIRLKVLPKLTASVNAP